MSAVDLELLEALGRRIKEIEGHVAPLVLQLVAEIRRLRAALHYPLGDLVTEYVLRKLSIAAHQGKVRTDILVHAILELRRLRKLEESDPKLRIFDSLSALSSLDFKDKKEGV